MNGVCYMNGVLLSIFVAGVFAGILPLVYAYYFDAELATFAVWYIAVFRLLPAMLVVGTILGYRVARSASDAIRFRSRWKLLWLVQAVTVMIVSIVMFPAEVGSALGG